MLEAEAGNKSLTKTRRWSLIRFSGT